ncbi:MAG: 5-oxoprolinase subunit C family protein [Blastococcus sp.]
MLTVLATGPQVLVQDRGRFGYAHLGVPRAGALDAPAAALANRLVGNDRDAAVLESLLGGLVVRTEVDRWVAVTGAAAPFPRATRLRAGDTLAIQALPTGMRSYLAVAGGIDVPPVLGSRSTDTLAGVGPKPVEAGDVLPIGAAVGAPAALDTPRPPARGPIRVLPGPHADWFGPGVLARLAETAWVVAAASDRVGLRLEGEAIPRTSGELASEGTVLGAIQVPPDGRPVILLADHGPTGGYPVAGVVHPDDVWQLAQARPGESLTLRPAP